MIKLKKLIAIAVLATMLPRTVMAQGDGKKKMPRHQKIKK